VVLHVFNHIVLAVAVLDKELGLAVVSLLCSVVKGSCKMVTAVEQDGLSVVMSS
jgi:hypothetical protein